MSETPAFTYVCETLEASTSLDRLEARGTVRLALKESGLEARTVTPKLMSVMVDKVLPKDLESRGVSDVETLCADLKTGLSEMESEPAAEEARDIFRRLGGKRAQGASAS